MAGLSAGQAGTGSRLADDVADEARAPTLPHSLAMPQDVEDPVETLIQLQLSELLEISLHNKIHSWKTNRFCYRNHSVAGYTWHFASDSTASSS